MRHDDLPPCRRDFSSRGLKGRKIVLADQRNRCRVHGQDADPLGNMPDEVADWWRHDRPVEDRVVVRLSTRVESRVEAIGRFFGAHDSDIVRKTHIQRAQERVTRDR
jgi:hypothetical protein